MLQRRKQTTKVRTLNDFDDVIAARETFNRLRAERDALQERLDNHEFQLINGRPTPAQTFDPLHEAARLVREGTLVAPEPPVPSRNVPTRAEMERDLAVLNRRVELQEAIVTTVTDRAKRAIADETGPAVTATHARIVAAVAELKDALEAQDEALAPLVSADIPLTVLEGRGVPVLSPPASRRSEWCGGESKAATWLKEHGGRNNRAAA